MSKEDEILGELKTILSKSAGIDPNKVNLESKLKGNKGEDGSLNLDSLDGVELTMGIDDKYGIGVKEEDAQSWETIGDVVRYIERVKYGDGPGYQAAS